MESAILTASPYRGHRAFGYNPDMVRRSSALVFVLLLAGCSGGGGSATSAIVPAPIATAIPRARTLQSTFKHVILIVQENRSVDNLFNGFPGADTLPYGIDHNGAHVPLASIGLGDGGDIDHSHRGWLREYNKGKMNGFDRTTSGTFFKNTPEHPAPAFAAVPRSQTVPYWDMASQYTFSDRFFQSNSGPSFPAHLYLIAGGSKLAAENPSDNQWNCTSRPGASVDILDPVDPEVYIGTGKPCTDAHTLGDELDEAARSWRYYAPTSDTTSTGGIWSAYASIPHIRFGADWSKNVITPETTVLDDIAAQNLPEVSWVVPNFINSDHAGFGSATGPDWVAAIVNAVGTSGYWQDTAIFVLWDDWGGWYDHVKPPQLDSMGLGFRVPLIAISAYSRGHYVSHNQYEFGSLLRFIEDDFHLQALSASDARAAVPLDLFDFASPARIFVPIATSHSAQYFRRAQSRVNRDPDD